MNLSIGERIALINCLQQNTRAGSFLTLRSDRKLLENLSLSEGEFKDVGIRPEGNVVKWDGSKDPNKEFEFSDLDRAWIKSALKTMNTKEQLTQDYYGLYLEFVGEEGEKFSPSESDNVLPMPKKDDGPVEPEVA